MTTNTEIVNLPSAATVDRLGQATAVEQSRAIAQVQAAVVMARQFPRSQQRAIAEMRDACGRQELAERAFFKFPRAGQTVTGSSVYLARELARIWGNLDYGLNEMRRDDTHGQSEMQAYAWDLETNSRSTRTFVIEHARDTKQGRKQLTELRDISDNNNNYGARAVREMIFAVLPQWFTDMASDLCRATLRDGGGEPLAQRIEACIKGWKVNARITQEELEARVGAPADQWTHEDVADLNILAGSFARREITRDEAFPPKAVDAAELTGGVAPASPASPARQTRAKKAAPADEQPAFDEQQDETEWVNTATGEVKQA